MTLTDVYCRFNRARGMEVCFLSVSINFSPSSRKSFDIPQLVYKHSSFLFGSLSLTSLLHVMPTLWSLFYFLEAQLEGATWVSYKGVFFWVWKSNWFCATRLVKIISPHFFLFNQKWNQNQSWLACIRFPALDLRVSYMYLLQVLIGPLHCLRSLWLARVITLVLTVRHCIENRLVYTTPGVRYDHYLLYLFLSVLRSV